MLEVSKQDLGLSAEELQSKLLAEVAGFVAGGTQSDDVTFMTLARDLPGQRLLRIVSRLPLPGIGSK